MDPRLLRCQEKLMDMVIDAPTQKRAVLSQGVMCSSVAITSPAAW
jgi:hypothetical protein